ncbi:hypothetical protein [Tsuneonella mangrovi]|uniref:hypothetical protein n=1 Tax=Tsuneonella mangrovi TaxID=1982042 RepID=UPI000BA2012C|nr:hypothetical protein [Tsuneonella mangrovi]
MKRTSKTDATPKAPVSAHPAFPAIVALWFAALFGIGSMVLPAPLLDKLVTVTRISHVFASATPPLGATARIVIALVACGLGVVAGIAIARKVVAAQGTSHPAPRRAPKSRKEAASTPAKRPISAHEELGEEGLDAPIEEAREPIAGRRRALSLSDESARSEFLDHAPLPGSSPVSDTPPSEDDTLDLAAFDSAPGAVPTRNDAGYAASDTGRRAAFPEPEPFGTSTMSRRPEPAGDRAPFAQPEQAAVQSAADAPFSAPQPLDEAQSTQPTGPTIMTEIPSAAPFAAPPAAAPAPQEFVPTEPENIDRPLAELSISGLVTRFARALEQHRMAAVTVPPIAANTDHGEAIAFTMPPLRQAEPDGSTVSAPFAAPEAENAAAPVASVEAPSPYVPEALRPLTIDETNDDDTLPDLDLSATFARGPVVSHDTAVAAASSRFGEIPSTLLSMQQFDMTGEGEDGEEEADDSGYTSLLAMKSPFNPAHETVRIEDEPEDGAAVEPIVVFPGQGTRQAGPTPDSQPRDIGQASVRPAGFRPFDAPEDRIAAAEQAIEQAADIPAASAPRVDSAETEKRLREALEKLQKMSGAA